MDEAPGEFTEEIAILEFKAQRIGDPDNLRNVRGKREIVRPAPDRTIVASAEFEIVGRMISDRSTRRSAHRRRD